MWINILQKKVGSTVRKPYTVQFDLDDGALEPGGTRKRNQREKSFATLQEAREWKSKREHEAREGTYLDPKLAAGSFIEYARDRVGSMAVSEGTRKLYNGILETWIEPFAGTRSLQAVANDREGVTALVNKTMSNGAGLLLSYNRRGTCLGILLAVCDEAVDANKLTKHSLARIKLVRSDVIVTRTDFVFPSHAQVAALAAECGIVVWLMRACGLRINEALSVERRDFRENGTMLRVIGQASLDGTRKVPLKHRRAGEFRDVPVPGYLWEMVRDLPARPAVPQRQRRGLCDLQQRLQGLCACR